MREMKGLSEGYKRDIDQKWGSIANIGFFARKPRFRAPKKHPLLDSIHVLATTRKKCCLLNMSTLHEKAPSEKAPSQRGPVMKRPLHL